MQLLKLAQWTQPMAILAALLGALMSAHAQSGPHIGYAYPAGGRQGSSFEVVVGGQLLEGASQVYISGAGIQAAVIEFEKPLTQQQFVYLRDKLKVLMDKKQRVAAIAAGTNAPDVKVPDVKVPDVKVPDVKVPDVKVPDVKMPDVKAGGHISTNNTAKIVWTEEDEKMAGDILHKLANPPARQDNQAIAEKVRIQVDIPGDAAPGNYELRLLTPAGLSNPLVFQVGLLREFNQKAIGGGYSLRTVSTPGMNVILPAVLNGQIMPAGLDRYRFPARKGQRLVVAVSARELIPYLPGAATPWFQASVALRNANGKELPHAGRYLSGFDPVQFYAIPFDGEYSLEIRDAANRGREDFVYRIVAGDLPYVTDIFPLGAPSGTKTSVSVEGLNLRTAKVIHDSKNQEPGVHRLTGLKPEWLPREIPFDSGTLSECLELEPNNAMRQAQLVTPPIVVNGRVSPNGDRDVFGFLGRAGEIIVAEVTARRLHSPLDSTLRLTDADGNELAFNDDHEAKDSPLYPYYSDSWLEAVLPSDGTYYVQLTDARQQGDSDFGYRLRIGAPRPDYELRIAPSTINACPGDTVPVSVFALRKDGFTNEIAFSLKGAPAGFALSGARIPAFQDFIRCTVTLPPEPLREPVRLHLDGFATLEGRELVRPVKPSDDVAQAFTYRQLVPSKNFYAATAAGAAVKVPMKTVSPLPVRLISGGMSHIQLAGPLNMATMHLAVVEPHEGIVLRQMTPVRGGVNIVVFCDGFKFKPGFQGNLILGVYGRQTPGAGAAGRGNIRRAPLHYLPAIPFEIEP